MRQKKGFTLIEIMIVVGIIGILTAIALPSYLQYIARSHRADARSALLSNAQFMERYYTSNNTYATATTAMLPATASPVSGTALYSINFATGQPTAGTYTITATPNSGTSMANDACASLSIDQLGNKTVSSGATLTANDCWSH